MEINNDFVKEMMEFKGTVQSSLGELCKDIKELKTEREKHSEKFWLKMDVITQSIQDEKNERITVDGALNTEIKVMQGKATVLAGLIAFFVSIITGIIGFFIRGNR